MNATEFINKCKDVANRKTLYVMGCFGAPMTATNKERYCANHSYNQQTTRTVYIRSATSDTFGFDCVCFIKAVLWGWTGDLAHIYGGAKYGSNGVPDIGADQMFNVCTQKSNDFDHIIPGEAVWVKGHIGVYVGDGLVVECTPQWKNGVQVTACNRTIPGYNRRNWTSHGRLPYIDYTTTGTVSNSIPGNTTTNLPTLKKGNKSETVRSMQQLLIAKNFSCGVYADDGEFGNDTAVAVRKYREKVGLATNDVCDDAMWRKLLGLM